MILEASIEESGAGGPVTKRSARVLYVTDGFAPFVVGGMQTVARRQIEMLAGSGFEVISVSSRDGGAPQQEDLGWPNIFIPWPARTFARKLSPYRYVRDLELFSEAVMHVIAAVRPDCIYSEGPLLSRYFHLPRHAQVPVIFHPHGLEMFQQKGSRIADLTSLPLRGITRWHAQNAGAVLCQSGQGQLMHILTQRCGVPRERIFVLPNAVPSGLPLALAPKPGKAGGRFLFIGRNEPRKGIPLLLKAFEGLAGATLDMAGGYVPPRGAPAGIRAHGEVRDRARILELLSATDFLVVPSYAEGMPTVILEAFAQGVPVIATDVGACAGAVRTGQTGFLIPPGDARALRGAMAAAMALDGASYARLSANCLEEARTTYAPAAIRDQLTGLILRMTAARTTRSAAHV
jgi:glycosyltransferase involved in cell wall biosynthesis